MKKIKIQVERLKRHYENSINKYDIISFLDLSNCLRGFTEEEVIKDMDSLTYNKFLVGSFPKKIKKYIITMSMYILIFH